jgi:hypothetical protein
MDRHSIEDVRYDTLAEHFSNSKKNLTFLCNELTAGDSTQTKAQALSLNDPNECLEVSPHLVE